MIRAPLIDDQPSPDDQARINNALADPNACPGHTANVATEGDPKRCRYCGTHVDEERD